MPWRIQRQIQSWIQCWTESWVNVCIDFSNMADGVEVCGGGRFFIFPNFYVVMASRQPWKLKMIEGPAAGETVERPYDVITFVRLVAVEKCGSGAQSSGGGTAEGVTEAPAKTIQDRANELFGPLEV